MDGRFVIWWHRRVPNACVLNELTGFDQQFRLNDGTALAASFPAGVSLHMDPDFPDDLVITDSLRNADMLLVVRDNLKKLIEGFSPASVEFLPIAVVDHKGRPVKEPFFIVHPVAPVDAIDRAHSVFEEDLLEPGAIDSFERLVIDESKVPAGRMLFRLAGFWDVTLVAREIAEAIEAAGMTGVRFLEIDDYPEA